jgi:hypothetical protein
VRRPAAAAPALAPVVEQVAAPLCRLQIVELFLQAVDLRLVLSLNFSDLILQLFDLIVADGLRRGRHRQNGARQAGDQAADHPLSGDVSLSAHRAPREINFLEGR